MIRYWQASAFAIGILLLAGCDKKEGVLPKTDGTQQSQASRSEENKNAPSQTETERDTYMKKTREEIDQLRKQIDALAAKAKNSSAVQSLQEDMQVVERKWQELKGASATAWKEMTQSLNESIEKVRNAIKKENS